MAGPINFTESIPGSVAVYENGRPTTYWPNVWAWALVARPATVRSLRNSSGWRPPLPWSMYRSVVVEPEISTSRNWNGIREEGNAEQFLNVFRGSFQSIGNLEDLAVNAALLNLSNMQADYGENFAQRQQAIDMAGDRAKQIANSVRRYKVSLPNDWRKVKKLVRYGRKKMGAIPNSWLELQYGWKPLLSDVYGTAKTLQSVDKDQNTFRVSVKGTRTLKNEWVSSGRWCIGRWQICQPRCTFRDFSGVFVRLDYAMVNPAAHELQELGFVNPALLAWNLLPYSFVVDWFLPVGDWFQAWTADMGFQFLGGSISTLERRNLVSLQAAAPFWYDVLRGDVHGGRVENLRFKRVVLSVSPAPRMPHFKNPLSLGHFANAMSLLVSAFK